MEGTIFNIQRFSVHDGPGVRTTVFLKGCPLQCQWCHNPESINPEIQNFNKQYQLNGRVFLKDESVGYHISPDKLIEELKKDSLLMEESNGGVTFSGGEPLMQYQFLLEILDLCKQNNLHTIVDTSLYANTDTVMDIAKRTDLFLVDLKLMDHHLHAECTGVSNRKILDNIKVLADNQIKLRIRIPLIPSITDTNDNIKKIIDYLLSIKDSVSAIDLLPFHNIARSKYERFNIKYLMNALQKLSDDRISEIQSLFSQEGFETNIGGN